MADRVHVHIDFETTIPPEGVVAALSDFSASRPDTWPSLDPAKYKVHEVGDDWAEVTEGNRDPDLWARERYQWGPRYVSIKAVESNFCVPGDGTEIRIEPNGSGGSQISLDWEREAATPDWEPLMQAIAADGEAMLLSLYRDRLEELAQTGN
jgi:hypothetical protein